MTDSIQVLHVDDDADFLDIVATYLERTSDRLAVSTCTDSDTALDYLDEHENIECIVSDYDMPDTNGLEFLTEVRQRDDSIPFILYTGKGSEEIASEAISAGVTEYVHKDIGTDHYAILANTIENVVGQYRAKRKVRENERRFRALIENSSDIISVLDEDGRFQYQSPSAERILGYPEDALIGERAFEYVHPDDRDRVVNEFTKTIEHGERIPTVEYRFRHKDGSWCHLESTGMNRLDDPAVEGFIVNSRDVTQRETLRSEIRDREQKIKALHDVATELEGCDARQEVYDRTVEAAEQILDFEMCVVGIEDQRELVVQAASEDLPEAARTRSLDEGLAGKTYRTGDAFLIRDATDSEFIPDESPYESGISVPIGDRGNFQAVETEPDAFDHADLELAELLVAHTSAALENIDRTAELERKNKRLEEFSSVLSHDLRSPLNIAQGMIGLTKESGDLSHLSKAENALQRMNELIEDLLSLAKEGDGLTTRAEVSLAEIARQAWETSATEDASLSLEESLDVVSADPSRLQTLFENLFRNAVEHGGSDVTVRVGTLQDGFYVADDGTGLEPQQQDRLFDHDGLRLREREGFGLVIVQQVLDAHEWDIHVTESESGGARFEITVRS